MILFNFNLVVRCVMFLAFFFAIAHAWQDEGHMITAAIARILLPNEYVEKIEKYFNEWNHFYPNLGNMITAATWPDFIKNLPHGDYTEKYRIHSIQSLDIYHYEMWPYNPQNLPINCMQEKYHEKDGAVKFIDSMLWQFVEQDKKKVCRVKTEFIHTARDNPSVIFAINMNLRLLIHVYGDLHQPLHTVNLYYHEFPNGYAGGNHVSVKYNRVSSNFHSMWDSNGFKARSRSTLSIKWVENMADYIMKKYPPSFFGERLENEYRGLNVTFMCKDTVNVALKYAFTEFDFSKSPAIEQPYTPSEKYVETMGEIYMQQLALGGYRLTEALKLIVPFIEPY